MRYNLKLAYYQSITDNASTIFKTFKKVIPCRRLNSLSGFSGFSSLSSFSSFGSSYIKTT